MSLTDSHKQRIINAISHYHDRYYARDLARYEQDESRKAKARYRQARGIVSEHDEQKTVVGYLEARALMFCACVNGAVLRGDGLARAKQMAYLKAEGLRNGAPDLIVWTPVPNRPDIRFIAIEMKSATGKLSESQVRYHEGLRQCGGVVLVGVATVVIAGMDELFGFGCERAEVKQTREEE